MNVGETITISLEIRNPSRAMADPAGPIALYLIGPAPKFSAYAPVVVHDGTGLYHADFPIPTASGSAGDWTYFWDLPSEASGHIQHRGKFTAEQLLVPPP